MRSRPRRVRTTTTSVLWLVLWACAQDPRSDGGGPARDAAPGDGSLPFDVRPAPDVPWPYPDAGPGCGDLGAGGHCEDGGLLRWCEHGAPASVDCTARALGCGLHPGLDDGAWCLAALGQSCAVWPCRPELRCEPGLLCVSVDAGED